MPSAPRAVRGRWLDAAGPRPRPCKRAAAGWRTLQVGKWPTLSWRPHCAEALSETQTDCFVNLMR
eukprot:1620936-Alexandrium_andersonii.AAC.1